MSMTIYTFEGQNADDTVSMTDLREAQSYARENGVALIANDYEWVDDEMVEDHRPADDPSRIEDER